MLLMNDQSAVMSGGDSGQDGEEPALPSGTAENEGADGAASGHQDGHTQLRHLAAEGRGALTGEVGQEDEEMTSASNDLSSSANESPGSARGCPSPSTKRGSKDREGEMRYNPFRITPYLLKVQGTGGGKEEEPCCLASAERIISGYEAAAVVGAPLTDITMSSKAMSVVSVTSQCSYSSTIVHATALEDAPMGSEPAEPAPTPVRPTLSSATEERRLVGLTKEVLSAHTQKEEQEYVDRFRHRILQSPYSSYLQQENGSMAHSHQPGDYLRPISAGGWNRSRKAKSRHKRPKPQGSSDSYASPAGPTRPVPYSSWPSSESSQPQMAETYSQTSPVPVPFFPVLGNPGTEPARPQPLPAAAPAMLQPPEQLSYNFNVMPSGQSQPTIQPVQMEPMQNFHNFYSPLPLVSPQSFNPYMAPVMAIILPSYPNLTPAFPSVPSAVLQGSNMITGYAPGTASFPQPQFQVQTGPHTQTSPGLLLCSQKATSSVGEEEETAGPQALFSSSRSSSPLQLNLLQEELPKLSEGQSSTGLNHSESLHEQHAIEVSLNLSILL
ncbi:hypothetical protein GOODEAATRI_014304 [Goodea atripinnis]|uniref:Period circadian protein homolog 1-3 PAS-A domain-containing protein n=1 Tax=Goodea atripinnis TaxID=208336 RepID=A0ABV0PNT9_9TELE